jgi:hypothetical protein
MGHTRPKTLYAPAIGTGAVPVTALGIEFRMAVSTGSNCRLRRVLPAQYRSLQQPTTHLKWSFRSSFAYPEIVSDLVYASCVVRFTLSPVGPREGHIGGESYDEVEWVAQEVQRLDEEVERLDLSRRGEYAAPERVEPESREHLG